MGRLQKKKDPSKKKAQSATASDAASTLSQAGANNAPVKSAPVIKRAAAPAKPKTAVQEENFLHKSIQFLREVKIELKKVTWPTRKQTMGSTVVVIVLVVIIAIFLGVVDFGLSKMIQVVLP